MHYTITKEDFDKLPGPLQAEYTEKEGVFTLKLEGFEDHFVPKGKRDIEAEHRKNAEKRLAEAQEREAKLVKDLEAASGNKEDMEKVRQQYEQQVAKMKEEFEQEKQAAKSQSRKAMIESAAEKFAQKHFLVPSAIKRLFQDRLMVEEVAGQDVIRTLEANGQASIKSLQELEKEFLENPEFKSIVRAEVGSGSGAVGTGSGGATKKFNEMTSQELVALKRSNPEAYQRLKESS